MFTLCRYFGNFTSSLTVRLMWHLNTRISFPVLFSCLYDHVQPLKVLHSEHKPNNKPSFQNAKMQVTWAYSKHNKKTTTFITVTFRSSSVLCTLSHYNSLIGYLIKFCFPEPFYFNIRMISLSTQAKYLIIIIRFRKCILWHKKYISFKKKVYSIVSKINKYIMSYKISDKRRRCDMFTDLLWTGNYISHHRNNLIAWQYQQYQYLLWYSY